MSAPISTDNDAKRHETAKAYLQYHRDLWDAVFNKLTEDERKFHWKNLAPAKADFDLYAYRTFVRSTLLAQQRVEQRLVSQLAWAALIFVVSTVALRSVVSIDLTGLTTLVLAIIFLFFLSAQLSIYTSNASRISIEDGLFACRTRLTVLLNTGLIDIDDALVGAYLWSDVDVFPTAHEGWLLDTLQLRYGFGAKIPRLYRRDQANLRELESEYRMIDIGQIVDLKVRLAVEGHYCFSDELDLVDKKYGMDHRVEWRFLSWDWDEFKKNRAKTA